MAALHSLKPEPLTPRRSKGAGSYTITGKGVNTSSQTLGSALSKAITIASRLQKQGLEKGEESRSIIISMIGGSKELARVDVTADLISTKVTI